MEFEKAVEESLMWTYELQLSKCDEVAQKLIDDLAEKGIHLVHSSSEFLLVPMPIPDATFGAVQEVIERSLILYQGHHPGRDATAAITSEVFNTLIVPLPQEGTNSA